MEKIKVLSIGYDKDLFDPNSRASKRIIRYGELLGELNIIVFTRRNEGFKETKLSKEVNVFPTKAVSKLGMISNAYFLGKKIGKGTKVITTQDPFESGFVGFMLKNNLEAKLHIQEHGDFFSAPYWRKESFLNNFRIIFGKFVLKRADRVRVVAKRIKNTLIKLGVDDSKIDVSNVYTERSFVSENKKEDKTKFTFLSVGRLVPQKNFDLLLSAFSDLSDNVKNESELIIIGDGFLMGHLKTKIKFFKLEDKIKLLGHKNNVKDFYNNADVFVLSSNYEGWGRVILEAGMAKLPVVMTDVGCAGELIKDKESGLVIPIGDKQKLKEAMEYAFKNREIMKIFAERAFSEVTKANSEEESVLAFVQSVTKTSI